MRNDYKILTDTIEYLAQRNQSMNDTFLFHDIDWFVAMHPLNKPRLFKKQITAAEIILALKAFCKGANFVCPYIEKL